jgi:hypothetical protein
MKQLIDNMKLDIYPKVTEYLVGTSSPKQRHLSEATLKKFRVGVGEEKFYDAEEETWKSYECVYFPMYAPLSDKNADDRLD